MDLEPKLQEMWRLLWLALALVGLPACQQVGQYGRRNQPDAGFDRVKPILESRCLPCHQGDFMGAPVLDFRVMKDLYDPARQPRIIVPGDPEGSRLIQVIYLTDEMAGTMPPLGHGLTLEEKNLLGEWILKGAEWPAGKKLQSAAVVDEKTVR